MSTYVVVEISPGAAASPGFASFQHATRPEGSSRSTASRTPSEIWSAILSGWPSVTDSEVKRYSLSFIEAGKASGFPAFRLPVGEASAPVGAAAAALGEVDDHRD